MSRVMLVHPNYPSKFNGIPLGLLYVASALKNQGHETSFLDMNIDKQPSTNKVVQHAKIFQADTIFMSSTSPTHLTACDYASALKKELDIPIVKGGPHETHAGDTTLRYHPEIDISCIGPGEETSVELVEALSGKKELKDVKGIVFRDNGRIITTEPRMLEKMLDNYELPDRTILSNPEVYQFGIFDDKLTTQMRMSRGCAYGCNFCGSESPVKYRSAENVMSELRTLQEQGYNAIFWDDAILTSNKKLLTEVFNQIISEGMQFEQGSQTRADVNITPEIMNLLSKTGFTYQSFGLESADPEMLKAYNKRLNLDHVERAVQISKDSGIRTSLTAIVGAPNETLDSIKRTVEFVNKVKPDFVSWSSFSYYPNARNMVNAEVYEKPLSQEFFWLNFDEGFGSLHAQPLEYVQKAWNYIQQNTDSNIRL